MQGVGHNKLYLHVWLNQQLPSLKFHAPVSYLLPITKMNRQLPFGIDLNKILPDLLLKLRTKVETPDIQFSQHIPYRYSLTVNVIYVLLINAFIKKLMKVKKTPRTQVQFQMCF